LLLLSENTPLGTQLSLPGCACSWIPPRVVRQLTRQPALEARMRSGLQVEVRAGVDPVQALHVVHRALASVLERQQLGRDLPQQASRFSGATIPPGSRPLRFR
jgi:hypothetical protein